MRPGVEHLGDVGVVHHRQGLPLGLEPGDDLLGVHARLDDLQRHPAADRVRLLGHEDDAHAAFADLLQQLVGADDRAGAFGSEAHVLVGDETSIVATAAAEGSWRKLPALVVRGEQVLDTAHAGASSPAQASSR